MPFFAARGQAGRGYFGGGSTPDAPTTLSSTPGNGQLSIAFSAPAFNGGLAITNYEWSVNAGATWTAVSPVDTTSPVVIGPLINGTAYTVYLRAVNALGGGKTSAPVSLNTTPYTVPNAPIIGSITTSINSPDQVSTASMTEDEDNASFTWTAPSAGGVAISVPFTPGFNGGSAITNYFYSTDNGATFKSAGTTASPISITTVSGSSAALSPSQTYNIRLYAVNVSGNGNTSANSTASTRAAVTSYDVELWDTRPATDVLVSTTNRTVASFGVTHNRVQKDYAVKVRANNDNGSSSYNSLSSSATGWVYSAYDADYSRTKPCTRGTGCDSCGVVTGTEDGTALRTCRKWSWKGTDKETGLDCTWDQGTTEETATTWAENCRDLGTTCSDSWSTTTGTGTFNGNHYTGFNEFMGSYYMYLTACPSGGTVCGGQCTSCSCGYLYNAYIAQYCATTGVTRVIAVGCKDGRPK